MSKIDIARDMAMKWHSGQTDKAGEDYFRHPEYVASQVESESEKIVAYLHDILEDTECPEIVIKMEFGEKILEAVKAMTHREGEEYFDYVRRVVENPIARNVKRADVLHNMDISRIPNPSPKDYKRLEKYKKALEIIG